MFNNDVFIGTPLAKKRCHQCAYPYMYFWTWKRGDSITQYKVVLWCLITWSIIVFGDIQRWDTCVQGQNVRYDVCSIEQPRSTKLSVFPGQNHDIWWYFAYFRYIVSSISALYETLTNYSLCIEKVWILIYVIYDCN